MAGTESSSGGDELWLDLGCILYLKPTGLTGKLNVEGGKINTGKDSAESE